MAPGVTALAHMLGFASEGTQFTGFTGTKVQILTALAHMLGFASEGTQFTGVTGTKVQILTQKALRRLLGRH
jgi:hypothetical protein